MMIRPSAARPGNCGIESILERLIDIATTSKPVSVAEAPICAEKKLIHSAFSISFPHADYVTRNRNLNYQGCLVVAIRSLDVTDPDRDDWKETQRNNNVLLERQGG
jgi:hypothetical protein